MPAPDGRSEADFEAQRPRLLGLAYRMVGSLGEAEDLVQEAWLRWHLAQGEIEDDAAWLTTVTSRLCLDHLRSARVRREEYVGTWLPEPVATHATDVAALRADGLSYAMLALLERLTPQERVAFVLREAFDAEYSDIGRVLDRTQSACRQLVSRARRKLRRAPAAEVAPGDAEAVHERLEASFAHAVAGDFEPLLSLLAPDAVLHSDGGGKVLAALRPIYGADKIRRLFAGLSSKAPPDLRVERRELNGEAALVAYAGATLLQTFHFDLHGDRIRSLYVVRNPDKLAYC